MTKADERITRLEAVLERLEALGLSGPVVNPASINPDGSPGHVAAGELIESAWGNAVSDEFARRRAWFVRNQTDATFPATGPQNFPGLTVTVDFKPGRIYKATAFIPNCSNATASFNYLYLIGTNGTLVLNTAQETADATGKFSMFTSWIIQTVSAVTDTINVRMSCSAGTLVVDGAPGAENLILVEEISKS
jgi:hypothetical protein